jgi:hypothetical protein
MMFTSSADGVTGILTRPLGQIVLRLSKPIEESALAIPSIAYRKEIASNKSKPYSRSLLVSWGYCLCTYLIQSDSVVPGKFYAEKINVLKLPEPIRNIGFLTPTVVSIYTNQNRLCAIGVKTVVSLREVTRTDLVYSVDINIRPVEEFSGDYLDRQIKRLENQKKIFVLSDGKMYAGSVQSYKTVIMNLAENDQWKNALDLTKKIYLGEFEYLGDIPASKEMRKSILVPFAKELVIRFVRDVYSAQKKSGEIDKILMGNVVGVAVDVLLTLEGGDVLFREFKEAIVPLGLEDELYSQVEPYIIAGKIGGVPKMEVGKLCRFYAQRDKSAVAKALLLSLPLEEYDFTFLVTTCVENGLLLPLITVCTIPPHQDYLMPAIKIYKEFSDAKLTYDQINESKYGQLCLWYIRMILRGQCLDQPIKGNLLAEVILQLGVYFFTEQILTQLLAFDCKLVLQVFELFFKSPNIDFLEHPNFRETLGVKKGAKIKVELTILMRHYIKNLLTIKATKYGLTNPEYLVIFNRFENSLLAMKTVEFTREDILNLIENDLSKFDKEGSDMDSIYSISDEDEAEGEIHKPSTTTMCLRYKADHLTKEDFEEIETKLSSGQHDEELAELHTIDGDYIKAYDVLYSSKHKFVRRKVFAWFDHYLTKLTGEDEKYMKELLLAQIKNLVALSPEETEKVLVKHCREKQLDAVKALSAYPNIQYEFLRALVDDHEFSSLSGEVRLLYLEVLLRRDPFRVGREVEKLEFPLEEALALCQKYSHVEASVLLLEQLGQTSKALEQFLGKFASKNYLTKVSEKNFSHDLDILKKLLNHVKDQGDEQARRNILSLTLKKLSQAIPYGVPAEYRHKVLEVMVIVTIDYIETPKLPKEASANLQEIISKVGYNMTFSDFKGLLLEVFSQTGLHKELWLEYDLVSSLDYYMLVFQSIRRTNTGTQAQKACHLCRKRLYHQIEDAVLFACGHGYHSTCLEKSECPECARKDHHIEGHLVQQHQSMDLLDINKLIQWNAELITDSLTKTVDLTGELTTKTGQLVKYLYDTSASAVVKGAHLAFGAADPSTSSENQEKQQKYLLQLAYDHLLTLDSERSSTR